MFVKMTSFLAAATMLMASPALANETTSEGMIDATTAVSGGIDAEFSELFASWESPEDRRPYCYHDSRRYCRPRRASLFPFPRACRWTASR